MLMVQVIGTGLQLLSKVILGHGQFIFALMAYRHVVGALCVAPFAFFLERGKGKELSLSIGFWLFMNALTGISMAMGLFYYGLRDTTATYATNFLNLIPIVTFVFSTIVGMEKLRLGTRAGKVKTMGAILCAAGALTISLYRGKSFYIGHHSTHHKEISHNVQHNWTRGTVFLVLSVLSYATWFMVQGMLATAATFCLISWAVANRGPTYPSMFNPLALILVTITEALFLGEPITVGSLIGMSLIIAGLYSFLWGKSKESKNTTRPKVAMIEASVVVADKSPASQTSAVVMPTGSPSTTTAAVFGNAKPNEIEMFF
ncbi:hypothetical protein RHSIM_Rhsim03G0217300 [Rhododendron simsii]|uniref:WAT1-related protein n=1 Tax=Rhododendron simsii TaxID=118357 RepID=A0A834HBZ0_RHOSS|nr:hypothetical protein RHSIM_Rhsim03G0217300 [Rhododendron simsii]